MSRRRVASEHGARRGLATPMPSPPRRARRARWRANASLIAFVALLALIAVVERVEASKATRARFTSASVQRQQRRANDGANAARIAISGIAPRRGHVSGGTNVTVLGVGFGNARELSCRFVGARSGTTTVVRATFASASTAYCVTPGIGRGAMSEVVQVTMSKDPSSGVWSAEAGSFVSSATSTFAAFEYDASAPGCSGCADGAVAIASRARETWVANATMGVISGGTYVRIKSTPAVAGTLGTFYPGAHLRCAFSCPKVVAGAGEGYARGLFPDPDAEYGKALWVAYNEIICVSPYWPGSQDTCSDGSLCASGTCLIQVSNDGATFDDLVSAGGDGDGVDVPMANAAYVTFTYDLAKTAPVVTSVTSSRVPEASSRMARGPFRGGTVARVTGSGFYQGTGLLCAFEDTATGSTRTTYVPGKYISATEIECVTPKRDVNSAAIDEITGVPCFTSDVRVSNTGSANDASWSALSSSTVFYYCDLYVRSDGPQNGDGSVLRPFRTIQAAVNSALTTPRHVSDYVYASSSTDDRPEEWLNSDVIRLFPGVYTGRGNTMLSSTQADVAVYPLNDAQTVIDCEHNAWVFDSQTHSTRKRLRSSSMDFGGYVNIEGGHIHLSESIVLVSCRESRAAPVVEECSVDADSGERQCRFLRANP